MLKYNVHLFLQKTPETFNVYFDIAFYTRYVLPSQMFKIQNKRHCERIVASDEVTFCFIHVDTYSGELRITSFVLRTLTYLLYQPLMIDGCGIFLA